MQLESLTEQITGVNYSEVLKKVFSIPSKILKERNPKLVRKTTLFSGCSLCSSCVSMRPQPAWTRRRTICCNKPSGRNFRTRLSSQLHTGKDHTARLCPCFAFAWSVRPLFTAARVTRINTIMDCERVLVLRAGKVVEFDTPAALCQTDRSIFQRLVGNRAE